MTTLTLNNIEFTITALDGEYFLAAPKALHHKTLEKCIKETMLDQFDIAWYSPKHGNFSVKGSSGIAKVEAMLALIN
jgi:hypothetical protein